MSVEQQRRETDSAADRILVWDLPVRAFHWSIVGCFVTAYLTADVVPNVHETAGYLALGLVVFRIWWGIVGTRYARFSEFVKSPRAVVAYARATLGRTARRHVGHNPAGGMMIVALLALLLGLCVSGWMQLTHRFFGVPWVTTLHYVLAHIVLFLIPLHVLGVIVSSYLHRENLVASMITGTKAADDDHRPPQSAADEQAALMDRLRATEAFAVLAVIAGCVFLVAINTRRPEPAPAPATETRVPDQQASSAVADLRKMTMDNDRQDFVAGGPEEPSVAWLIASGGRIYDNWFTALARPRPTGNHPSWPAENTTIKGADTWRCKSCHGWDYKGRDGQYASGPNATGIKGLYGARSRTVEQLVAILGNPTHKFTDEILPHHAKYRLALFITEGLHDAAQIVGKARQQTGDATKGRAIFQTVCAACHGFDGRQRKLGASADPAYKGEPMYIGFKAAFNLVELVHKVRNGHPGAIMISLRAFPIEHTINLIAYVRTLPPR